MDDMVSKEELLAAGAQEDQVDFYLAVIEEPMTLDEFEFYKEVLRTHMRLEGMPKESLKPFHKAIKDKILSYPVEEDEEEEEKTEEEDSTTQKPDPDAFLNSVISDSKSEEIDLTDPMAIRSYLSKYIIGQDRTIARVCMDIALMYRYRLAKKDFSTMVRLLIADAGQGKSRIFRTLSKIIPVKIVNLAAFSETAFKGKTIELDLLEDVEPFTIVVLDEADKKIRPTYDRKSQNINFPVLSELNMALSGDDDRCRSCIFYMLGAFSEIRERKKRESTARSIGFATKNDKEHESYDEITRQDLIAYGMPRELGSRITIIQMNKLTRDDFYNILKKAEGNPLELMCQRAAAFNVELEYDESFLEQLVDEAYQSDTGARGLTAAIDLTVTDRLFKAIENGEKRIVLTGNDQIDLNR